MTWAFWAVSFLFIITPGADWAYAISAGMRERRIAPALAGLLSGHVLATLIVAAGVGALLANSPMVMSLLTMAGADSWFRWAWKGISPQHKPLDGNRNSSGRPPSDVIRVYTAGFTAL